MKNLKSIFSSITYLVCCTIIFLMAGCTSCTNYEIYIQIQKEEKEPENKPILNVFIENSGSMDGYFVGKSDLRDDLYGYISEIKSGTSKQNLYYINTQIIPINQNLENFFHNLNAESFKAGGGNRAHSDIVEMMKEMLNNSNDSTITIFASDCILDLPSVSTTDFFNFKKTLLANEIRNYKSKHNDFGIRVLCLQSNFEGYLYPTGKEPIKVSGKRPYYIWMFGSNKMLGKLMKDNPDQVVSNNLQNSLAYSDIQNIPINIGKTKGAMSNNGKVKVKSRNPKFDVYADLSRTLLDEKTIENKEIYDLSPYLQIGSIEKIKYDGAKYTHVMHLDLVHASKASDGKIAIKNDIPKWVDSINDETGDKANTTCGIKYLIDGIKEAFNDIPQLTINLKISKI